MITGAHAWHDLPGRGQHLLRCLYQHLTEARKYHGDELAVILAGQAGPLRDMLHAAPALAARNAAAVLADAGNGHVAGNARLASSCSPRPPSARRTASPPVPSPVTRPPSPPSVMHGNALFDLARWRRA